MKHYLITGAAGFIGSHLVRKLLQDRPGCKITCIDNFDASYPADLKQLNIRDFKNNPDFHFLYLDLVTTSAEELNDSINDPVDVIIHVAAKTGIRSSIEEPLAYQRVNVIGLQHLLDFAKVVNIPKFVFASSSSVYGINDHYPWKETEAPMPISPYAMSKLAGEMLGHVYHHLFGIRFIALRLFTVYGPAQRPDLVIHKFTKAMLHGEPIPVYGDGNSSRDYTYVDDIVEGVIAAKALTESLPDQPGDVPKTLADISKAKQLLGYNPQTKLEDGLKRFYDWFIENKEVLMQNYTAVT